MQFGGEIYDGRSHAIGQVTGRKEPLLNFLRAGKHFFSPRHHSSALEARRQ
jgi:hypothetical protein